jgi:hypothetical protein
MPAVAGAAAPSSDTLIFLSRSSPGEEIIAAPLRDALYLLPHSSVILGGMGGNIVILWAGGATVGAVLAGAVCGTGADVASQPQQLPSPGQQPHFGQVHVT